jgi:hypothetical protein
MSVPDQNTAVHIGFLGSPTVRINGLDIGGGCCPTSFSLWKSFWRNRTRFRDRPETVRPHRGIGVHLHPGILFGFTPERRSASSRNPVHLCPDSRDCYAGVLESSDGVCGKDSTRGRLPEGDGNVAGVLDGTSQPKWGRSRRMNTIGCEGSPTRIA